SPFLPQVEEGRERVPCLFRSDVENLKRRFGSLGQHTFNLVLVSPEPAEEDGDYVYLIVVCSVTVFGITSRRQVENRHGFFGQLPAEHERMQLARRISRIKRRMRN